MSEVFVLKKILGQLLMPWTFFILLLSLLVLTSLLGYQRKRWLSLSLIISLLVLIGLSVGLLNIIFSLNMNDNILPRISVS
jgi:hypothetical protein